MLSTKFVNEGNLAEQFIAQHLLYLDRENETPRLNYWLREKKSTNSEVDFIVQYDQEIIPIEVKSGKSGSLRSLHQFIMDKGTQQALRFDTNIPSKQLVECKVKTKKEEFAPISFKLISLPLYMVEQYKRILLSESND